MAWKWPGQMLTEEERIKQNIANILETAKGDAAYERDLGISMDWLDKPDGMYDAEMLTEMTEQCNTYENRVETAIEIENGKLKVVSERNE